MTWKKPPEWLSIFSGGAAVAIAMALFFAFWYLRDLFRGEGYAPVVILGLVVLAITLFMADLVFKIFIKKRAVLNVIELALIATWVFWTIASSTTLLSR